MIGKRETQHSSEIEKNTPHFYISNFQFSLYKLCAYSKLSNRTGTAPHKVPEELYEPHRRHANVNSVLPHPF